MNSNICLSCLLMNSKICLSHLLLPLFENKICLSSLLLISLLLGGCVAPIETSTGQQQPRGSSAEVVAETRPSTNKENKANKAVLSEQERRELQQELAAAQKKLEAAEAELKAMLEQE